MGYDIELLKNCLIQKVDFTIKKNMFLNTICHFILQQRIICQVNVKQFEGELQWYYSICLRCKKDLNFADGRFQCPTCGRVFPHPDKM